jgi:high affinity sulfate transporter 1
VAGTTADAAPTGVERFVPGVGLVRSYQRKWLGKDVAAGLVLTALLVPQGMAYAELAGLPPITGLYTSILCLLGYAVFGPSRVLVLGPDSALGPMIAATLAPLLLAGGDPARAVALASALALLVGLVMAVAGLARLGFVADLLSRPTQIGYLNGLAITIVIGQLPKLLGFSVHADGLWRELTAVWDGITGGKVNGYAAAVGIGSLVLILVLQHWLPKIPAVLVAVVLSAVVVGAFDLAAHGVATIGVLPGGFPPFTVPHVRRSDVVPLVTGALAISLVALADTMSTASAFATRRHERLRGDQEMVGIGAANIAAGFFQGFPVSTSGSRTAVADQAGARSQLAGVVGALAITLILLFATGLMQDLPSATLAAIVIAAALSLVDIPGTVRLWRHRRTEFTLSIVALLGVAVLGVLPGILVAVGLSVLNVFRRLWWPHQAELGRVHGIAGLHDTASYPDAQRLDGLLVYRFDAPLIFANARTFGDAVRALVADHPGTRWMAIASEPVTDVDTTAAAMLVELDEWLAERGVELVFAEMKDPVRARLERYGLLDTFGAEQFFPTLDDVVAAYVQATGAQWHRPGARP